VRAVLRPGGGMVLYAVFATHRLEPGDRALLVDGLHDAAASMHGPTVEAAIAAAGFEVARRERIGSEWSEHRLERDPGYLTRDLLEIARLTRERGRFEAALGPVWYRRALAVDLWRVQIALGRLVPVLYALVKTGSQPARAAEPAASRPLGRAQAARAGSAAPQSSLRAGSAAEAATSAARGTDGAGSTATAPKPGVTR
jgi:hypothetical protein